MKTVFEKINITSSGKNADYALKILKDELKRRFGFNAEIGQSEENCIELIQPFESEDESYKIEHNGSNIKITAYRLRGFIYGIGLFFRKCEMKNDTLILTQNLTGEYSASIAIRGHGIGYTDMSNTYEAWDKATLKNYILELMFFGLNTVETSFARGDKRTPLMKYTFPEAMQVVSECCAELDIDLMLWYALTKSSTADEITDELMTLIGSSPKVTSLFLPGGDPGDMQAEDFAEKCRQIKKNLEKSFPSIQLWPSAQAPHEYPDWGEHFKAVMNEKPKEFTGIIYAPNHAMSLSELRRSIDSSYPIEHFPDICHNVRCESPVHFYDDDWHFAYAATLGRECANPRPVEMARLHRIMSRYVGGNCSYSEGVNDDVNKFVWSSLDYNAEESLREILKDYSRVLFAGVNPDLTADAIFSMEQSWYGDPAENSSVNHVLTLLDSILNENPKLINNWRYRLLLFRAKCDKIVRERRIFETSLLKDAEYEIRYGSVENAEKILSEEFSEEYLAMRNSLFYDAEALHNLIGIQLDTEHFGGMNFERGCVLDTIDMPVTDRAYILNKIKNCRDREYLCNYFDRNKVDKDEFYFSFALHGFAVCGKQSGEYYMDFRGDMNGDARLPMCITKGYDHFSFSTEIAGLTGGDYKLMVTYKFSSESETGSLLIKANGFTVYEGVMPGGSKESEFEEMYLPDGYTCRSYEIKKEFIENGCVLLEINENTKGFVMPEFRIVKLPEMT